MHLVELAGTSRFFRSQQALTRKNVFEDKVKAVIWKSSGAFGIYKIFRT